MGRVKGIKQIRGKGRQQVPEGRERKNNALQREGDEEMTKSEGKKTMVGTRNERARKREVNKKQRRVKKD